jgi:hypothetical protein
MLFVVTHVHPPELCPGDNPELVKKTVGVMGSKAHAEKSGVKVLGSYMAPEEHTFFFIMMSSYGYYQYTYNKRRKANNSPETVGNGITT